MRRIGAAALLALVVVGVVRLLSPGGDESDSSGSTAEAAAVDDDPVVPESASADDPSSTAAGDAPDPVDGAADADQGGSAGDDGDEPGPEPTLPDAAEREPRSGPPSSDDPARVLIVGDSDAGTFGPYLQQLLRGTGIVETELDYKVSSGLARPDFYDWHTALAEKVPPFDPDIVVVTFGGNDAQFLADASGASVVGQPRPDADNSAWTAEYRDRVRRIVEYLSDGERIVVWVGIPNHVNPEVTFRMQHQDQAVKAELAEHPEVRFVDTWTRFAGRNGGFAEFVIDPRDGQGKAVRASDGFHLNQTGAEILAIDIFGVLADELRELGATW